MISNVTSFKEKAVRFPSFLSFSTEGSTLSHLRVSLERVQPGMSDFIVRSSTPSIEGNKKSGTVVSIRGNKSLVKYDGVKKLASVLAAELKDREDSTYDWSAVNLDHLSDMLFNTVKYFAANTTILRMDFVTNAVL